MKSETIRLSLAAAALKSNQSMPRLPTVSFLGLPLVSCPTDDFLDWLIGCARARAQACRVGYLNAATVNLAFDSPELAATFRRLDALYADGLAVVWGARARGRRVAGRINAGDFIERFFMRCAEDKLSVGLIGGRSGEAATLARLFREKIPGISFVFEHTGYFPMEDAAGIAARLEPANPDIVLLGMGSPRQELLALEWSGAGRPRVWWCVGALFEYYSGTRRRAPVWMRRAGLEWLFRLALEPRRLWRRYLIGNPKFVWRVLRGRPIPDQRPPGQ